MWRTKHARRLWRLVTGSVVASLLAVPTSSVGVQVGPRNLEGDVVDPFQVTADVEAVVLLFVSVSCPISNRYAPEIQRLYHAFASRARFWLVYPNPRESPEAIRAHRKSFGYSASALRDPGHVLVKLAHATVTPEVGVFTSRRELVYRGRIDDRYVSIGVARPAATQHDLEEALLATLAGRAVATSITNAVGCFIADVGP